MSRRSYRTSIPAQAVEVVESSHPNGAKRTASFFMGPEKVGFREWDENGQLAFEYAERDGVKHGPEYHFYPNGQLLEKEAYHHGKLHGTGKQWAEDGRLLVTWKLIRGTGLDLWCDAETGTLAEEHFWPKEGERGYRRQWNSDEKIVWEEYFYVRGKGYHGVWRTWNARGKLRRGFPHFYMNNQKVTRRQYMKACETDTSLPPYQPEEDDPHRELPREYLAQRKAR